MSENACCTLRQSEVIYSDCLFFFFPDQQSKAQLYLTYSHTQHTTNTMYPTQQGKAASLTFEKLEQQMFGIFAR